MTMEMPNCPEAKCCGLAGDECVCPPTERALRAYSRGDLTEMTGEQREWCISEIASVEGYSRDDVADDDGPAQVANLVISAWVDYCRDKGLM